MGLVFCGVGQVGWVGKDQAGVGSWGPTGWGWEEQG